MFEDVVQGENWPETPGLLKGIYPRIECVDGTTLSVQASHTHYCRPRNDFGPYSSVEVGYPGVEPPESWAEHFDGDWNTDDRLGSVYSRVPVSLVRQFIADHGGEMPEGAWRCPSCGNMYSGDVLKCERGCGGSR